MNAIEKFFDSDQRSGRIHITICWMLYAVSALTAVILTGVFAGSNAALSVFIGCTFGLMVAGIVVCMLVCAVLGIIEWINKEDEKP